jgi:hypothetical protein
MQSPCHIAASLVWRGFQRVPRDVDRAKCCRGADEYSSESRVAANICPVRVALLSDCTSRQVGIRPHLVDRAVLAHTQEIRYPYKLEVSPEKAIL